MMTEPIRDKRQLKEISRYWIKRGNVRNYVLIVLGVCTTLRIGDLLHLTWDDVYDEKGRAFRSHISVTEQKTGKLKVIALNSQAIEALTLYREQRQEGLLFPNNRRCAQPLSRVQAWRIVKIAATAKKVEGVISCHSLRKTAGYHAWKAGVSPVVIMDIYGHSSYEMTKRYLGVTQDDRDKVYLSMALF